MKSTNWMDLAARQWVPGPPAATVDKLNPILGAALVHPRMERASGSLPDEPRERLVAPRVVVVEGGLTRAIVPNDLHARVRARRDIIETKTPDVLMVGGKAEVVVQDAESYQIMSEALRRLETIAAIREGLAAAERGESIPVEQVYAEMKAEYGLRPSEPLP